MGLSRGTDVNQRHNAERAVMGKVVDITKYLGKPRKKPKGRPIEIPDSAALWIESDEEGNVTYDCTSKKLLHTSYGKQLLAWWLSNIVCDLCYGINPELIMQLKETLEEFAREDI